MKRKKLVEIKGLKTRFKVGDDWATAVNGIDFDIYEGETLGIVGESGSGKSVSVLSLIQLIPNPPGEVFEGTIRFRDKLIFDGADYRKIWDVPEYKFFPSLTDKKRKWAAIGFFLLWLIIYSLLPIPGLLPAVLSFILDIWVTIRIFYNSPRKKAIRNYMNKLYSRMRDYRGQNIAMIFQEPMTSLNPVFTIGMQVEESLEPKSIKEFMRDRVINMAESFHNHTWKFRAIFVGIFSALIFFFTQLSAGWTFQLSTFITALLAGTLIPSGFVSGIYLWDRSIPESYKRKKNDLFRKGVKLLEMVGIPEPASRMKDYPHQFSGGMRQRVMIAMALAKDPSLLIADEPTTALDVTIQAQILDLMLEIKNKKVDSAIVLITHDLAVVAETCERVIVMYGGVIQEKAPVEELFGNPLHPYTHGLLASIPNPLDTEKKEKLKTIRGMVPSILKLPKGCKFCTRCDKKIDMCDTIEPPLKEMRPGHFVRCHVVQRKMEKNV
jgi:oligopeptide/dipeptide ABC transporter ATP-binding protein